MRARMLAVLFSLATGVAAGCFTAPSDDVLFACDPDDAPECPPGYACESDGCCHREGSDVEANAGACAVALDGPMETTGDATDGTDADTDTDTSETDESGTEETGTDETGTDETGTTDDG